MAYELKVPGMGESVTEVEIAEWLKKEGDAVRMDEDIVVLDSAKTSAPIPSPVSGTLLKILKAQGEAANVGDVMALIEEGEVPPASKSQPAEPAEAPTPIEKTESKPFVMPAAARELAQSGVAKESVTPTGPGGRMLKEDVLAAKSAPAPQPHSATPPPAALAPLPTSTLAPLPRGLGGSAGDEKIVPMTMLRRHIAQRLVEAQQTAALLTTFNEIDMSAAMTLRKEHQDAFTKKHGIKLGFMSFFVKATVDALKEFPAVNAEIRGRDLVYKNFYDIGVAIGSGKGLVVPVIRGADSLGFAQIEQAIANYAARAKAGTLRPEDLEGGTFTITNGGIYGSLMSTPIVNPPQSGILGMHTIQERPIALNGQVVIRPMMYVALTYDHRIIDGREAVGFLVRVKQCLENPARMLLEV